MSKFENLTIEELLNELDRRGFEQDEKYLLLKKEYKINNKVLADGREFLLICSHKYTSGTQKKTTTLFRKEIAEFNTYCSILYGPGFVCEYDDRSCPVAYKEHDPDINLLIQLPEYITYKEK